MLTTYLIEMKLTTPPLEHIGISHIVQKHGKNTGFSKIIL